MKKKISCLGTTPQMKELVETNTNTRKSISSSTLFNEAADSINDKTSQSKTEEPISTNESKAGEPVATERYSWANYKNYNGDPNDPDRIKCDKLLLPLLQNNERYLEHFNDLIYNESSIKEGLFRKQLLASWNDLADNINNKEFMKRISAMEKTADENNMLTAGKEYAPNILY